MSADEELVRAPLLTVAKAARYLGVRRKIIYRLIDEGRLTQVKVQGSTRIEVRELDEFKRSSQLT